ncbi:expressed unknown protein [Seminavis robusta]|uniref:Uncharacterized protein n=1 Tax=Seminavis robusta TaxID=568900 RepID=A0A9N8H3Z1_9STRA|nr:expressed unknown protein [Seminavis robusta]|eukprot:Sro100_g051180.1 n/a (349) ;mRNA; r:33542-34588
MTEQQGIASPPSGEGMRGFPVVTVVVSPHSLGRRGDLDRERSRKVPYFPRNPSRQRRSVKKQQQKKQRSNSNDQCQRSRDTRTTLSSSVSSLDDVSMASSSSNPRQSRWESNISATKQSAMAMPTRRRGVSPENDSHCDCDATKTKKGHNDTAVVPPSTQELKQLRRKFSGDDLSSLLLANHKAEITANSNAMKKKNQHHGLSKPRRQTSPARLTINTSPLAALHQSDGEEDDHVFVRRSGSNKGIFLYQRDDSQKDLLVYNRSKARRPTKDDVYSSSSNQCRRRPAGDAPSGLLCKLKLSSNHSDHDHSQKEDLEGLVRAIEQSEDHGHIFCSARNLLAFAMESDEE